MISVARYVGDAFTLTANVTDINGAPTDATSVTVTIRSPDNTTGSPQTMTHGATGVYTYAFTATLGGMHTASFVATGAVAPVGSVDFYVYPTGSAATGIVTLAETKTELRIASGVTTYDNQLQAWIAASRNLIEQRVGPMVPRTVIDVFDGAKVSLTLTQPPVISITSITEGAYTLTTNDYVVSKPSGIVTRMFGQYPYRWLDGRQNIIVTYLAGVTGVWLENIRLANLELLRTWWVATQSMSRPQALTGSGGMADDMTAQGITYYMPPRVEKMLGVSDLPPGIA